MGSRAALKLRGANLAASTDTIQPSYWGMHIDRVPPNTIWEIAYPGAQSTYVQTPWPDLGIKVMRAWATNGCTWRNIERSKGVFDWSRIDYVAEQAQAHGCKLMIVLGCGPDWATVAPGQRPGLPVGMNPQRPTNVSDYTDWVAAIVAHFAGRGYSYQYWNECNDHIAGAGYTGSGFVGNLTQMLALCSAAHPVIKANDPTAVAIGPSFLREYGLTYDPNETCTLESFLAAGGADYCDIVAVNGYTTIQPWLYPEGVVEFGRRAKQIMSAAGVTKPLWATEWGYGRYAGPDGGMKEWPEYLDDYRGAAYLTRMVLLCWLAGFRHFPFFGFDMATSYATIRMCDPATPAVLLRPATAYRYMVDLMTGGRVTGMDYRSDAAGVPYIRCSLVDGAGRAGRAYWCPEYATASVTLAGTITDNIGTPVTPGVITLDASPVFAWA